MYVIDYNADEPIMLLNKHIGVDSEDGQGIDGALFQEELLRLDNMGKKRIQVWINCPGGSIVDGMNIVNAILKSKTPVDTYNVGIAASMGGCVFMAGRKRYMADYAKLMVHNPSGATGEMYDSFKDALVTMMTKCNLPAPQLSYLMDKTTWMDSAECFEHGMATDIEVTSQSNKKWVGTASAMWKDANLIINNIFKENNMKKVTAKLKLVETANEDAIVESIEAIQNNLTEKESELSEARNKVAALEQEVAAEKAKNESLETTIADNAASEATEKATAMVTNMVKVGKIKNEAPVIEKWVKLAEKDLTGTQQMLEDLPINKVANKIQTEEATLTGVTAQMKMIEIANKNKQ